MRFSSFLKRIGSFGVALAFGFMAARDAFAIQIVKPVQPMGGQITAVTAGPSSPLVTLTNSGHYARALGTARPYYWSITPPSAGGIMNVTADGHIARFIASEPWAVSTGYSPFIVTVVDSGDGTSASIMVFPTTLVWTDGGGPDRIVKNREHALTRTVELECRGIVPITTLNAHAYHVINGVGEIDVVAFDGNSSWVAGTGCSPPPGTNPPFGSWNFVPPGGVLASWNPSPAPRNPPSSKPGPNGTLHYLTIEGTVTSSFQDDIEWDAGIEEPPGLFHCADGIGAVQFYTCCEMYLDADGLQRDNKISVGDYIAYDKRKSVSDAKGKLRIRRVKPDDLSGYQMQLQVMDGNDIDYGDGLTLLDEGKNQWAAPNERQANDELEYDPWVQANRVSSDARDMGCRIRLRANGEEMGGETCRDFIHITCIEYDVINPIVEPDGKVSTPVTDSNPSGDEFVFDDSSNGKLKIKWSVEIIPDTQAVRTDLANCIFPGVSGLWNGQLNEDHPFLAYDGDDSLWHKTQTYDGLPTSNDDFGRKTSSICFNNPVGTVPMCDNDNRDIAFFFLKYEKNHPGTGHGDTPNWWYYWMQTSPTPSGVFSYQPLDSSRSWSSDTHFDGTQWRSYITEYAARYSSTRLCWNGADGFELFQNVLRHEEQHRLDMIADWGQSDRDASLDADGDMLLDSAEAAKGYDKTKECTNSDTYQYVGNGYPLRDCEDYCLSRQDVWHGNAKQFDWACPGPNYGDGSRR